MGTVTQKQGLVPRIKLAVKERTDALNARYGDRMTVALAIGTFRKFSTDDASQAAAGLAYYSFLSIFPLLLGLIAILGAVLAASQDAVADIVGFAGDFLPGSQALVGSNLDSAIANRGSLGVIAVAGLIWSGSAIFGGLHKAMNRAWGVTEPLPFLKAKAKHLGLALGVGVAFGLTVGMGALSQFAGGFAGSDLPGASVISGPVVRALFLVVAFGFTFLVFAALYVLLPDRRISLREIWPGALLAAVLFELVKNLFVFYVARFTSFESVYGTIAPIIVLLVWVYFCNLIVLLGAEMGIVYSRLSEGRRMK